MGATLINGSFSSSNWRETINQLQNEERRYHRDEYGNATEDVDYTNYSGTILSVHYWDLIKMHNSSEKEIQAEILKENDYEFKHFDTWEGIVAEGPLVGYDLYTPTFSKLESLPFNHKKYININKGEYALLEYIKTRGEIQVLIQGDLDKCKKEASTRLYSSTDRIYVICGNRGNHYKCFNTVRRVKSTTKQSEYGKLKIKEVHNYYYAGMASV